MAIRFDSPSPILKAPVARRGDEAASRNTPTSAATADPKSAAQLTLGAALKKAGETARAFGDSLTTRFDEARKSSAREQVAQIRERIQMLKRLILLFGGSKALLRELKQLAGALAAAADVLKGGGGGGSASAGLEQGALYTEAGVPASGASPAAQTNNGSPGSEAAESSDEQREAEALAAQAESELAALGAKADPQDPPATDDAPTLAPAPVDGQQAQRRADADLLEKALRELKVLLALAKSAQRKADRDDQKRIKDIEEQVEQVEQAVGELNGPASLLSGFAGISVRA
jgi:hypothetical protein